MWTDRQTGMTKLNVAFHDFGKAPKVQNVLMNSETMKQAEHWASVTDSLTK